MQVSCPDERRVKRQVSVFTSQSMLLSHRQSQTVIVTERSLLQEGERNFFHRETPSEMRREAQPIKRQSSQKSWKRCLERRSGSICFG